MPLSFPQPRRAATAKPAHRPPDCGSTASALSRCSPTSGDTAPGRPSPLDLPAALCLLEAKPACQYGNHRLTKAGHQGRAPPSYSDISTSDAVRRSTPSPRLAKRQGRSPAAPSIATLLIPMRSSSTTRLRLNPTSADPSTTDPRRRASGAKMCAQYAIRNVPDNLDRHLFSI